MNINDIFRLIFYSYSTQEVYFSFPIKASHFGTHHDPQKVANRWRRTANRDLELIKNHVKYIRALAHKHVHEGQ